MRPGQTNIDAILRASRCPAAALLPPWSDVLWQMYHDHVELTYAVLRPCDLLKISPHMYNFGPVTVTCRAERASVGKGIICGNHHDTDSRRWSWMDNAQLHVRALLPSFYLYHSTVHLCNTTQTQHLIRKAEKARPKLTGWHGCTRTRDFCFEIIVRMSRGFGFRDSRIKTGKPEVATHC